MRTMKRYSISLVLILLTSLSVTAQQENAAFYIYQNDGHFNGFFYDEVEKISYSKLDTLGIEHEEFVSQEIITADSTYRIMLSAIDSVGFVQPEVKFNSRMRDMRKEGMIAYLTGKDNETLELFFLSSMPESLRPRSGDVLVDFDLNEGFGGKVRTVSTMGDYLYVECDTIGLRDVFLQFITVEQQDQNRYGQLIRRRTAGMPQADIDNRDFLRAPYRASDTFEGNIFNFSLSGHYTVLDSADVTLTIDANIASALTIKGSYNIPLVGAYYIGLTFQNDLTMGLGLTIDAKVGEMKERQTPFKASLPIPAAAPIFELRSVPGLFLKGDAHVKFSADIVKYRKRVWHKLEFNNDWLPSFNFGDAQLPELDDAIDNAWERDASIEFSGTIMAGIHGPLELGINSWLRKVLDASFGIHSYIGPKLTGAMNLSLSNIYKDKLSVYNLYKDTKLALQPCSFDYECTAELNTWLSGKKKVVVADGSVSLMSDIELYLFPDFNLDVSVTASNQDPLHGKLIASITPSRNIIFPAEVGIGIFRNNELYDSYFTGDQYYDALPAYSQLSSEWKKKKSFEHTFTLSPGKYQVRPMFQQGIFNIIASPVKDVIVPGPYISVVPDTVVVGCEGGIIPIDVATNCDSISINCEPLVWYQQDYSYYSEPPRAKYTYTKTGQENIKVDLEIPRYYQMRDTTTFCCRFRAYYKDETGTYRSIEDRDRFIIKQCPNNKLLPTYLKLSIDHEDGKNGYINLTDRKIPVTATRSGNIVHVECKYNKGNSDDQREWSSKFEVSFDIDLRSLALDSIDQTYRGTFMVENGNFKWNFYEKKPYSGNDSKTEEVWMTNEGHFGGLYTHKDENYLRSSATIFYLSFWGEDLDIGKNNIHYVYKSVVNDSNVSPVNEEEDNNIKRLSLTLFFEDPNNPWDGTY